MILKESIIRKSFMAFCLFLVGFGLMFGVALSDRARGAEVESLESSEISSEDAESAGDSENSGDDESSGGDSRKGDSASEKTPEFSDFSGLDGKRVAMLSGAPFADQVDKVVKDAKYSYYDSFADIILALEANKIDAALNNSAVAEYQANKDERLAVMVDPLQEMDFGIAFKKGSDQVETWTDGLNQVGEDEIEKLWDIWIGADDSKKVLPEQDWPGENGTVKVAILDNLEPMGYRGNGETVIGFDAAVILAIAEKLDVKVEFKGMELAALLPTVSSGKADLAIGSMLITDARLETMDMIPYHSGNLVLLVRNEAVEKKGDDGFIDSLKAGFRRTFIDEDRYILLLKGLVVTLIISILSGIFGLLLGFGLVYLNRMNNKVINGIIRVLQEIIIGLPAVVILMVLYYVIFGKTEISAVVVAVIGFTIMFGIKTFDIIINAIKAVDPGQMEAALSLGYKQRTAFRRIILPQAKEIYYSLIRTQFVVMIKDTSIVGFIAVIDLTRAGDLIRSRTLEAFFPLITVAVIYFIIIKLLSGLIGLINEKSMKAKKEKSIKEYESILQGRWKKS